MSSGSVRLRLEKLRKTSARLFGPVLPSCRPSWKPRLPQRHENPLRRPPRTPVGGPFAEEICGPEGFKRFVGMVRSALPDWHVRIEEQVAEGELVATRCGRPP